MPGGSAEPYPDDRSDAAGQVAFGRVPSHRREIACPGGDARRGQQADRRPALAGELEPPDIRAGNWVDWELEVDPRYAR
ncbi:MAG: hypothetical protein ACRDNS_30390, partial [Trebonia sp.]